MIAFGCCAALLAAYWLGGHNMETKIREQQKIIEIQNISKQNDFGIAHVQNFIKESVINEQQYTQMANDLAKANDALANCAISTKQLRLLEQQAGSTVQVSNARSNLDHTSSGVASNLESASGLTCEDLSENLMFCYSKYRNCAKLNNLHVDWLESFSN
jgi:hypothetical protein